MAPTFALIVSLGIHHHSHCTGREGFFHQYPRAVRDLSYFLSPEPSTGLAQTILSNGMKVWVKSRELEEGRKGRRDGMIEIQREEQTVEQGTEVRRSSIQAPAVSGCVTSGQSLHLSGPCFFFYKMGSGYRCSVIRCVGTPSWMRQGLPSRQSTVYNEVYRVVCTIVTGKATGIATAGERETGSMASTD